MGLVPAKAGMVYSVGLGSLVQRPWFKGAWGIRPPASPARSRFSGARRRSGSGFLGSRVSAWVRALGGWHQTYEPRTECAEEPSRPSPEPKGGGRPGALTNTEGQEPGVDRPACQRGQHTSNCPHSRGRVEVTRLESGPVGPRPKSLGHSRSERRSGGWKSPSRSGGPSIR